MTSGRLVLAAIALFSSVAWADAFIPDIPDDGQVMAEQVEASIAAVQRQEGLDDPTRTRIMDQLRDAQAQIQNRRAAEQAAADFTQWLATGPAEAEALRQQLAEEPPASPIASNAGNGTTMRLSDLEQMLAREAAALTGAESKLGALEAQIDTQEMRPEQARRRIIELQLSRNAIVQQMHAQPPPAETQLFSDARRLAMTLRRDAQSAELSRLEQELLSHSARIEVLYARRDLAQREVSEQRQRIAYIQMQVNERRREAAVAAHEQAEQIERAAAEKHPVVREIARGNAALTRELPAIAVEIERATAAIGLIEQQAHQLEEGLARSRQRLEIGGISQAIGQLLIDERRNLPDISELRAELRARRKALSSIGLTHVRIDEQRRELTTLDQGIREAMAGVRSDVSDTQQLERIEDEVRSILQNRRELLRQAANTHTSYLTALGDLDVMHRRLLGTAEDYEKFLERNLLWIPSSPVINTQTVRELVSASRWLLSPDSWFQVGSTLLSSLRDYPLPAAGAAILFVLLTVALLPLKSRFKRIGGRIGRVSTDHIGLTIAGLLMMALRALPIPLVFVISGAALSYSPSSTDFSSAVAAALLLTAPFLYHLRLYRIFCSRNGLARIHFGWPQDRLQQYRGQLDILTCIGVPWLCVTVLAFNAPEAAMRDSLGRVLFIGFMILLSVTVAPLLREPSGDEPLRSETHGFELTMRLRRFWFALAAGGPLILALFAALGYQYTSAILIGHLIETFWLMLGLLIANLLALRWLSLTRRRLAWRIALQKREESQAAVEQQTGKEGEGDIPVPESKPIDLDAVDQQTRRLLRAGVVFVAVLGLWGIWSEVLPALNIFEQVSLWSRNVTVDGRETVLPVTLADLLLALVIIVVTVVAAKNLPGLMEIALLQRLKLETGNDYAINTLMRYFVVAVGTIWVFSIVGWNWSQIQWLVAAMGVGLGFGLQEIVANFVSGLIILFERPVRVGDTVTVGTMTGTVSRLRIRATTITDWDRKEVVVPNKSFITEQVVNWTLSDPITRIVIPVGIAYGCDVKRAHRIMEDTLRALPLVLDDPPPKAYFVGFGDSALNFNLYLYSRQLSDRMPLMHAVHEEILTALQENGIEIPFPQRDLRLRSIDAAIRVSDDSRHDRPPIGQSAALKF